MSIIGQSTESILITKLREYFPNKQDITHIFPPSVLLSTLVVVCLLIISSLRKSRGIFIIAGICIISIFLGRLVYKENIFNFDRTSTTMTSDVADNPLHRIQLEKRYQETPKSESPTPDTPLSESLLPGSPLPETPTKERPKRLYTNNQTGVESMKKKEVRGNRDMLNGYRVIQPPVIALNALRKISCTVSVKKSIDEQISSKMQKTGEWNMRNGNALLMNTMENSKRMFQRS